VTLGRLEYGRPLSMDVGRTYCESDKAEPTK